MITQLINNPTQRDDGQIGDKEGEEMKKYYVSMIDKFLSYWGQAEGKIARYINICDSYEEALIVAENAKNREDQKNIRIHERMPQYSKQTNLVMIKTKEDMPNWYNKDFFKKTN